MTYKFLEFILSIVFFIIVYFVSSFIHKIALKLHNKYNREEIYDLKDFIDVESDNEMVRLFKNIRNGRYERIDVIQ